MIRAQTHAEAYAARWPGNTRAEFDAERARINAVVLAEVEAMKRAIRSARTQREGR